VKLIIVSRSKPGIYQRLTETFAGDSNVKIIWDRRTRDRRRKSDGGAHAPERRSQDRRRLMKPLNGRDYVVIHTAHENPTVLIPTNKVK
jgi:hypothetical protein